MDLWEGSWIFISDFLCVSIYHGLFLGILETYSQVVSKTYAPPLYLASFMLLCPSSACQPFYAQIFAANTICFFLSFFSFPPTPALVLSDTKELWSALGKWASSLLDATHEFHFNGFFKRDPFTDRILSSHNGDTGREPGILNGGEQKCGDFFQRLRWCPCSKTIHLHLKYALLVYKETTFCYILDNYSDILVLFKSHWPSII